MMELHGEDARRFHEQMEAPPQITDTGRELIRGALMIVAGQEPSRGIVIGDTIYADPSLGAVAAIDIELDALMEQRAALIEPINADIANLESRKREMLTACFEAGLDREEVAWGTYTLIQKERRTARSIDEPTFVRMFPQHLAACASVKIRVTSAEKVLSEEDFEKVVVPATVTLGSPELHFEAADLFGERDD